MTQGGAGVNWLGGVRGWTCMSAMGGKRTLAGYRVFRFMLLKDPSLCAHFSDAFGIRAAYSYPMKQERSVIAEGRFSSLVILTGVPMALLVGTILWLHNGGNPQDSMYYRASPILVIIMMSAGLIYAAYEFLDTTLMRRKYVSTDGVFIYVLHHRPVAISEIRDMYLERGLLSDNLVILERGRQKTKIRTHFLKESGEAVLRKLDELTERSSR
jgi:hypothetical protein